MFDSTIVGIDAHARKNVLCAITPSTGEVVRATLPSDPSAAVGWISENLGASGVTCVYESGPTGFGLCRALREAGIDCRVAAASKLPKRTDAQKNDRRDAEWLARQMLAGAVREVRVPDEREEALRALSHLRRQRSRDVARCKQRANSFLLLRGLSYPGPGKRWTRRFRAWAGSVAWERAADAFVMRSLLSDVDAAEDRLRAADAEIAQAVAADAELAALVARLGMIQGIGPVTAFALAAEVCDFSRFSKGSQLASFVGLCPSESSSGDAVRRGRIDKRGNAHLRCLLMEAAPAASRPARGPIRAPEGVPPEAAEHARKCNARLAERSRRLRERGVPACKAKVAVARELCEWVYHIMVM